MSDYKVVSSDSHVVEPPDLWVDRIDAKYKDRAPRLVAEEDGDWWYIDGRKTDSIGENVQAELRFTNPEALTTVDRFENVRPGGYIPDEFVKDLDIDGVAGAVVYPSIFAAWGVADSTFLSAIFHTYNDWLAEFCQSHPDRIKGIAMINVDDIQEGVKELKRTHKNGLTGAMITTFPLEDKPYDLPDYEPLWATAEEMQIPLSLHLNTNRDLTPNEEIKQYVFTVMDYWVRVSLANIIYSGVFERHPNLKIGAVEHEVAWAPYFIQQLDFNYSQRPHREGYHKLKEGAMPSDYFRQNVFISFQEDALGLRDRNFIGRNGLMWGNDYPHEEGTFPRSRQVLEEILAGIPEEDQRKIAWENAARLYHFN